MPQIGLWKKITKKGKVAYSGSMDGVWYTVVQNKRKGSNAKAPDLLLFVNDGGQPKQKAGSKYNAPQKQQNDDEVPF